MFLGVVFGTSSVKALLVDPEQRVVGSRRALGIAARRRATASSSRKIGGRRCSTWWTGCAPSTPMPPAPYRRSGSPARCTARRCSTRDGRLLRPAILWNDGRARPNAPSSSGAARAARDRRQSGDAGLHRAEAALGAAARAGGLRAHRQGAAAQGLCPLRLTGEMSRTCRTPSGTLWLDVGARALVGELPRRHRPRAHACRGWSRARAGRDAPPGARGPLGHGSGRRARRRRRRQCGRRGRARRDRAGRAPSCRSAPRACCSAPTDRFAPAPASAVHAFCHALPATWHQMGVIAVGGRLARLAGLGVLADAQPPCWRRSASVDAPSPLKFLPYLYGERTPHNDAADRGAFVGLRTGPAAPSLSQAVLEGVAFAVPRLPRRARRFRHPIAEADVVGGGSRSRRWVAIIASVLGSAAPARRRRARRGLRRRPPRAPRCRPGRTRPRFARRRAAGTITPRPGAGRRLWRAPRALSRPLLGRRKLCATATASEGRHALCATGSPELTSAASKASRSFASLRSFSTFRPNTSFT